MGLYDELVRIADEAAQTRQRLEALARAAAALRAELSKQESPSEESPRKLQSVS